jgi:hypothetical protein
MCPALVDVERFSTGMHKIELPLGIGPMQLTVALHCVTAIRTRLDDSKPI